MTKQQFDFLIIIAYHQGISDALDKKYRNSIEELPGYDWARNKYVKDPTHLPTQLLKTLGDNIL